VYLTLELQSEGTKPMIPTYKLKCASNHYQAKADVVELP
jgi:hypothetical protein